MNVTTVTTHTIHNVGVAIQIGEYTDSVKVRPNMRWFSDLQQPPPDRDNDSVGPVIGLELLN